MCDLRELLQKETHSYPRQSLLLPDSSNMRRDVSLPSELVQEVTRFPSLVQEKSRSGPDPTVRCERRWGSGPWRVGGGGGCEERKADRPYLLYSGEKSSEPAQRFARLLGKGAITNTAAFVGIGGKSNVEKDKVVDSQ